MSPRICFPLLVVASAVAVLLVPRAQAAPGDLYVSTDAATIDRITPAGARSTYISSGLTEPEGVAFDSSGNLYVADYNNRAIYKYAAGTTTQTTFATIATGNGLPYGLVFDASGNLYAASGQYVFKYTPAGAVSTYATGLSFATSIAFDSAGNLYVANQGNSTITKIPPGGGTGSVFASSNLSEPGGIAINAANDVYVANNGSSNVVEFSPAGALLNTYSSGVSSPDGLALDAAGNLYVGNDGSTENIEKITPGGVTSVFNAETNGPELLTFQPTPVPEPATWALMMLGGGVSLLVMRRRSRA